MQSAYIQALERDRSRLRPRARRHRQDLSRRRLRRAMPGARARSTASSCRVRRSRRASGWAFCRATCARRSIPICARSMTLSTTCCRRARSSATSTPASSRSRRSLSCAGARWRNAFVILDEAQNTTSMQMKMFLTRLGEGSQDGRHRRPEPDRSAAGPASPGLEEAVGLLDGVRGHRGDPLHIPRRGAPRPRARIVEAYDNAG